MGVLHIFYDSFFSTPMLFDNQQTRAVYAAWTSCSYNFVHIHLFTKLLHRLMPRKKMTTSGPAPKRMRGESSLQAAHTRPTFGVLAHQVRYDHLYTRCIGESRKIDWDVLLMLNSLMRCVDCYAWNLSINFSPSLIQPTKC